MARKTAAQVLADEMQKMKDMGVTISTTRSDHGGDGKRVVDVLADAAREAGIYEEENK